LVEKWGNTEVGNCWNVALGDFGGGYVAATTDGGVHFFDDTGKRHAQRTLEDATSLESLPLPNGQTAVAAINKLAGDVEELVALQHDRILFRKRFGREGDATVWRWRRLVAGSFLGGDGSQIAVLRGDGAVAIYDHSGNILNVLAARDGRRA